MSNKAVASQVLIPYYLLQLAMQLVPAYCGIRGDVTSIVSMSPDNPSKPSSKFPS